MARGDHLITPMDCYTHHGIDLGDGTVVHWTTAQPGAKLLLGADEVRRTSLNAFGNGGPAWVRQYVSCFDADKVAERALSRVGERGYHLSQNNCEHFATWCKTGRHESQQVNDVAAAVVGAVGIATAVSGSLGIVSAAGPVAGLSSSGTVAGLAAVGRVVSSSPATALVGLMGLPAAVSAATLWTLFVDEEVCPTAEREARAAGRAAGLVGAVSGTATAVGAVAAAGVPGLSALGIATGLATIGAGSVAVGLATALAFPAAVTLGAGWLAYRLCGGGEEIKASSWGPLGGPGPCRNTSRLQRLGPPSGPYD